MRLVIRKAASQESAKLAELMNLAGEGIPAYLWENMASPEEDVMEFGARRVATSDSGFSYTNAHVATIQGAIAGMLLGYRLPDPYEIGSLAEVPSVVRPLLELEALVPGSWYINAIAADPACRGQGVGSRLMRLAEQLAVDSGAEELSLIVAEDNVQARTLYEKLGYRTVARREIIQFPNCPHTGDWVLMSRAVESRS